MKKYWGMMIVILIVACNVCCANSVSLINDSPYTLKAALYDANGALLGEFVLNPRDATMWNDNYENAGPGNQYIAQVPYTVNWYCMNGGAYGTCENVAAGSTVTAQGCGGDQECPNQPLQPY